MTNPNPRVDKTLLIWVQDAAKQYGQSRRWFAKQIKEGKLHYARVAGPKRLYLLRSDLEVLCSGPVSGRKNPQQDASPLV
jgi:hypothetical protein